MADVSGSRLDVLANLAATVDARKSASAESSYTARLLQGGVEKCAKKFGEEAVEAALAAVTGEPQHLAAEAADVLYHLLVLLASRDISLDEVMNELDKRTKMSGLEEKASRKGGAAT